MVCRDRSVFSLVSFSFDVGMVVEICPVGSGVLPSGTITFPDGVVITAGGGGVLVLLATVAGAVEPLFAVEAGTPAEGFFATFVLGFLGLGAGAGVVVVVVVVSAGVAGAVVVSAGGGVG